MSAEADYLRAERAEVEKTLALIENLIDRGVITEYETIAFGKLLQDVYMGIERILRCKLENQDIRIPKTESWHKELLLQAQEQGLVSENQFETFQNLLLFRHLQVHGYGHRLDEVRLREIAEPAISLCKEFLENIK